MKYICRPGVVLEKICGVNLLIPTHEASSFFPHVLKLSFPALLIWSTLSDNQPLARAERVFERLSHKPAEDIHQLVQNCVNELAASGALISLEEEG